MNRKVFPLVLAVTLALILLPTLLLFLSNAQTAHAATLVVNIFFDQNDGICNSSCSLRDAISAATNGDDIFIPAGTYTLSATNGALAVSKNLVFNGNNANDTFIDAQDGSRVFNVTAGTVFFNDLTIQNGNAVDGAGIRISGATTNVTLNNATLFSNSATTNGGGIYVQSGALTLQDSSVVTNTAVSDGGGLYSLRGAIIINNSSVSYNTADRAGGVFINQDSASLTFNSGEIANNSGSLAADTFPGGGIFVGSGSATLNGGQIKNNQAFRGGGILVSSGRVTLNDAEIISNTATYGGGVYVVNSTGWFTQTAGLIASNQSTATVDFGGGGLYIFNGNAALMGGVVMTNTAAAYGGGMEVRFGTLIVDGATITNNQAGKMGGGIYNSGGTVSLNNALIGSNNAQSHGGGLATNADSGASQTFIGNSSFYGNTASNGQNGGGIFNGGIMTVTNSTISFGSAGNGAGLYNGLGATATLTNATIIGNSSSTSGGGINNQGTALRMANTIVADNSGAASTEDCAGTITSLDYNLTQTSCGLTGSNDLVADPLLNTLDLYGGSTPVAALKPGSPAIDAGNNATCPAADQRGNLRPVGGACDIGAYEDGIGFFINDASLTEGDAGSAQMSFIVSRSFITDTAYTVDFETLNDSALSGLDYTAISNTLTFLPETMTQTLDIDILGDTLDEDTELFTVLLSNPSGASQLGDGSGTGTILDNDAPPSLSINDVTITEGSSGTVTAVFTATLATPSGKTITVDYQTMDGTAVSSSDYVAISNTLTFNPGDTEKSINITINSDTLDEFDETFTVELSNPSNVTLTDSSGQATITDDDAPPSLSIADANVSEGNNGTTNANFIVTLSAPSGKTITATFMTNAVSASAGIDYVISSGTVTFNPGEVAKTIPVVVNGDTIDEINETFQLNLSGETNATLADGQAIGTILDDDPQPTATINNATVVEGDSGTVTAVFTITLSATSEKTITINYSSDNGSATAGQDYTAVPPGVLSFNPGGPLSQTISVTVHGDETAEPNETFFLNLTGSSNVTLSNSQGIGTIIDDDGTTLYIPFVIKP